MDNEIKKEREKRITKFDKNKENPFMNQAIESIDKNIVKKYKSSTNTDQKATLVAYDPNTSEILGHTRFIRQIEVDEEQFTKLYLANFRAFFNLSQSAIRVFGYIMTCLKPKNDMILFILDDCKEYTNYNTVKPIYKGLEELLVAEIIARGPHESLWFINPMMLFNGDRVSFARTYVKKKQSSIKSAEDIRQLSLFESEF
jgi:ribosomal protein S20